MGASARRMVRLVLACVLACAGGCSDSDPPSTVAWGACPNYPEYRGIAAQCAFIPMPLDHADPNSRQIPIFVTRILGGAPERTKRGQLWFVTGGPASSAIGFVPQAQNFAAVKPEWDYYVFEQRGVGNSAPLTCAAADAEGVVDPADAPACLAELENAWPEGIGHFSVTNTALDLENVIERVRAPGEQVVVYGVSYGTYLVQRYLALSGEQASAAVLDSIVSVGFGAFDSFEHDVSEAARMIMERCAKDTFCEDQLTSVASDPWAAMAATYDALAHGTLCPALQARLPHPLTADDLRTLFGTMTERIELRGLMPAVVLRLNRCNAQDVEALAQLTSVLLFPPASPAPPTPPEDPGPGFVPHEQATSSPALFSEIVLSELWNGTPLAQLEQETATFFASLPNAVPLARLADAHVWPVYHDPLQSLRPSTDVPVLMMNSDLDPQTPLVEAEHARDYLDGINQRFVVVPNAGHIVILDSPLRGATGTLPTIHCGSRILLSFLDDPTAPPDTSCIPDVAPLSFDPSDERNRQSGLTYFGTPDIWGSAAPVTASH